MAEFVFLYRGGEAMASPAETQKQMQAWVDWMRELGQKGLLKAAGHPLERDSKVVSGKAKQVTDGPFAEKDLVGGFSVVEARDLAHAAEISKGCPVLTANGRVEVRPVMKFEM